MQTFVADTSAFTGSTVTITGNEHHHATRSCRVRHGEMIAVTDGAGRRVVARISRIDSESLDAVIEEDVSGRGELTASVTVALAMIAPARFETAAEKCTELGVRAIIPVHTFRCEGSGSRLKMDRLHRIVREASKQSGRSWIPDIHEPADIVSLAEQVDGPMLVGSGGSETPLSEYTADIRRKGRCTVMIGPEGDFTQDEHDLLLKHGASFFSLGGLVLRAETAAIVSVGLLADALR